LAVESFCSAGLTDCVCSCLLAGMVHFGFRRVFERLLSNEKLSSPVPFEVLASPNAKDFSQVRLPKRKPDTGIVGGFLTGADMNSVALELSTESGFPVVSHQYARFVLDSKAF
jgi:hypothetical protein